MTDLIEQPNFQLTKPASELRITLNDAWMLAQRKRIAAEAERDRLATVPLEGLDGAHVESLRKNRIALFEVARDEIPIRRRFVSEWLPVLTAERVRVVDELIPASQEKFDQIFTRCRKALIGIGFTTAQFPADDVGLNGVLNALVKNHPQVVDLQDRCFNLRALSTVRQYNAAELEEQIDRDEEHLRQMVATAAA